MWLCVAGLWLGRVSIQHNGQWVSTASFGAGRQLLSGKRIFIKLECEIYTVVYFLKPWGIKVPCCLPLWNSQIEAFRRPSFTELLEELGEISETLESPHTDLTTGWAAAGASVSHQPFNGHQHLETQSMRNSFESKIYYWAVCIAKGDYGIYLWT